VLANLGTPRNEIGVLLGHTQISTTQRYADHAPQRLLATAAAATLPGACMPPTRPRQRLPEGRRGGIHPVSDAGRSRGVGDVDGPPVPGQEFIQVRCGMISDAAQDIGQPGAGIDVVQLSCCDQRVHGSGALPAAI
jgi:hypothetical protein